MNDELKIQQHFTYDQLPKHIQVVAAPFHDLALHIVHGTAPGPERTAALRKLLEARDAAVRAKVHPGS